ncbi:hypothetical protein TKK_0001688 [Trichogramma kaykai]
MRAIEPKALVATACRVPIYAMQPQVLKQNLGYDNHRRKPAERVKQSCSLRERLRVMDLLQNFFGVSWYPILKLPVLSLISWALGPIL